MSVIITHDRSTADAIRDGLYRRGAHFVRVAGTVTGQCRVEVWSTKGRQNISDVHQAWVDGFLDGLAAVTEIV